MVFVVVWVLCPPSYLPPTSSSSLPPSLFCPLLRASRRFYSSCVQHLTKKQEHGVQQLGPERQSGEEASGSGVCTAHRGAGPPPSCSLPASAFRVKFKATRTRVHHAQKKTQRSPFFPSTLYVVNHPRLQECFPNLWLRVLQQKLWGRCQSSLCTPLPAILHSLLISPG